MSRRPKVASDGVPDGLGVRGAALWADLTASRGFGAADLVLLAEACRVADRLERLDLLLRGDVGVWARLLPDPDGLEHVLQVGGVLSEARQQQNILRQLVVSLGASSEPVKGSGRSVLDDLAARRAGRGAGPAAGVDSSPG